MPHKCEHQNSDPWNFYTVAFPAIPAWERVSESWLVRPAVRTSSEFCVDD